MAKQSIQRHKKYRDTWAKNVEGDKKKLESLQASYNDSEARLNFYITQIREAEIKGMDMFDDSKFLVKRKKAI